LLSTPAELQKEVITNLSKCLSDLKQNGTQEKAPFFGTVATLATEQSKVLSELVLLVIRFLVPNLQEDTS